MANIIRYALATFCFAASVGCLALWWRSLTYREMYFGPSLIDSKGAVGFAASQGLGAVSRSYNPAPINAWVYSPSRVNEAEREYKKSFVAKNGYFSAVEYGDGIAIYFPLWYPALIFALAGVAALRFRRQFSIRSAMIYLTAVAALLGMTVVL